MRLLRTLSFALTALLVVTAAWFAASPAYADDVADAEKKADDAQEAADQADGLVDDAVANRDSVAAQLAETITRINDLSAEMSIVAAALTKVEEQIVFADAEMTSVEAEIEDQAVDAYMDAIGFTPISFVSSDDVETAMVANVVVDEVVSSSREVVSDLIGKKRELESLEAQQQIKQDELDALKAELDAEVAHLEELFGQADSEVADAIRDAIAADQAYRDALSAVDVAKAKQEEQERQDNRPDPPDDPGDPTTTTSSPTTTVPPTTPTTSDWNGDPGVEQWRELAEDYFPASRVDEALQIMGCESGGDPNAYNPYSGAAGLYQFLPSTWASTAPKAGFGGASPFDPEANIAAAAWLGKQYEDLGLDFWQPWSCRRVLD